MFSFPLGNSDKKYYYSDIYIIKGISYSNSFYKKNVSNTEPTKKKHIRGVTIRYYFSSKVRGKVTPFKGIKTRI